MKRALIIGPAYAPPNALQTTANDVKNWYNTLAARGFSVVKLTGASATRAGILSKLKAFITSLKTGDSGAIIYLGHGATVVDLGGDEPDLRDECIVSSDLRPIRDDELNVILAAKVPGAILDVVLDCCYSGTGTRFWEEQAAPQIDSNTVEKAFRGAVLPEVRSIERVPLSWREWAAGAESEVTYGVLSGGRWNSIFSLYLCWAIRTYPAKTATELLNTVAGYVTGAIPAQHPQLEGVGLSSAAPF